MVVLRRFADDGAHRRHVEVLDPAAERVGHEAFGEGLQEGVRPAHESVPKRERTVERSSVVELAGGVDGSAAVLRAPGTRHVEILEFLLEVVGRKGMEREQ